MSILCKMGFHRSDKTKYIQIRKVHKNGKVYHYNRMVCKRCGKMLTRFAKKERR